ncbi:Zinc finger, PMZ-type [Parasponia andersonii]|uniref:Zinc finger, PMZ-type n=1 Tax=Parasponia andersonii TaxID=3476 RepID=A0A2P5C492_PARAD|nr:Zinc finger, PMZ-type [Parasponia andersonii]
MWTNGLEILALGSVCCRRKLKKRVITINLNGMGEFQILVNNISIAVVNLIGKSCSCRRWDLTGIPCENVVATIYDEGKHPEDYVDSCYLKSTYIKTYEHVLHGIRKEQYWYKTGLAPLKPPPKLKQPGRPKKLRTKSVDEVQPTATKLSRGHHGKITCSQCREVKPKPNSSHNVATPSKQPEPHIGHDIPHHTRDFDGQTVAKFQSYVQPTWIPSWWPTMSEDLANMGVAFLVSQFNPTPTKQTKDKPQTEKTFGLKTKQNLLFEMIGKLT